jgi:flavin-dependent dehydrogenase
MNLESKKAEVIIVGGGPAGAATAVALARAGRKVRLLEARNFKQPQPSDLGIGEVLSPGAQFELARLGFPCEPEAGWRMEDFSALRQYWAATRSSRHRLPANLCYWQIDRGQFDRAMLNFAQQAGVEVCLGHRVKNILRQSDHGPICGVSLQNPAETNFHAPLVVDAAGRNSPLLARLGLKLPESEFQRFAVVCFFSEVPATTPGEWEQHFLGVANTTLNGSRMRPGLYRYTLETDLTMRARFESLHKPLDLFLAILEATRPALAARFREATPLNYAIAFAPVGYRVARPVQAGLVLVGDATGYLDPATGQGIEFALRTARLAAPSLERALSRQSFLPGEFQNYEKGLEREIARAKRDLRIYLRLTRQKPVLQLFSRSRILRELVIRRLVTPRAITS